MALSSYLKPTEVSRDSLYLYGLLALLASPLIWLAADYARILRIRRKMPPGPFPLPLVGNFFQLPKHQPWVEWETWSDIYKSSMITIWNGHRPVIICNDIWSISELLDKRAAIYSSRPHHVVMGDMMNMSETNQVCQKYGDAWRLHRRLMHTIVGSQSVRNYRSHQSNESKVLLRDLLLNPDDFDMSIERYSCSVVSILGWGRRIDRMNDTVAQVALSFMEGVNFVVPGLYIMEAVPWLAKLPGWLYPLPSIILKGSKHMQRYFAALAKEAAVTSTEDNFSKRLLAAQREHGITDEDISSLTANMIGGGVDTTTSSTLTLILAMCVFPEVQRKAQEELDRVVGQNRYPEWTDEEHLPYIRAVNTAITGNLWAIHRNPREFPEPDVFRPERFLNGLERPYPNKKGHNAFGWGRRQCSGQPLAEQGLFITIARMIWAFNMQPGLDENNQPVKLDIFAYSDCENMRPEKFKARFTPRTQQIKELVLREAAEARQLLRPLDGETAITMASVA
ncbi:hypothetical protein CDV36_009617 [Fusarium kuroshium]|uniref:Cytochrome P450 n=1 Tax=Fusarium kuroshium TaxID=2010991 RepID=A0A3M2RZR9_9HYPO|nr:hypothetical protein CDV36_009617 [Fusarium kuroshium]